MPVFWISDFHFATEPKTGFLFEMSTNITIKMDVITPCILLITLMITKQIDLKTDWEFLKNHVKNASMTY